MFILANTPCKCAVIIDVDANGLLLLDADKLPLTEIQILSILVDGVAVDIFTEFPTFEDFFDYLNSGALAFDGLFLPDGGLIRYTNPENFQSLEIVAIQKEIKTVIQVGNPGYTVQGFVALIRSNGTIFSFATGPLAGLTADQIHSVEIGTSKLEPASSVGYAFSSSSGTTTLDFSALVSSDNLGIDAVQNSYIYIQHSQTLT